MRSTSIAMVILGAALTAGSTCAQTYLASTDNAPYSPNDAGRTVLWSGATAVYDDAFTTTPLGFSFDFYGETYTDVTVSSNGFVCFDPAHALSSQNSVLPGPTAFSPRPLIAPWWDDLIVADFGTPDEVSFQQFSDAFTNTMIIEWSNVSAFGNGASDYYSLNFQVHLVSDATQPDHIRFHYGSSSRVGLASGLSGTMGLQNGSATYALSLDCGAPLLGLPKFPANGTLTTLKPKATIDYQVGRCTETYSSLGIGRTVLWNGGSGSTDNASQDIAIPFIFDYYGVSYPNLRVSTNGYCTFSPNSGTEVANQSLPSAVTPNAILAPWWDDLAVSNVGAIDEVSYQLIGNPGTRELVVQWEGVSQFQDTAANHHELSFQLHIFEVDGAIEFHYGASTRLGTPAALSATIGIENSGGVRGTSPYFDSPALTFADFPLTGTVLRFDPPLELLAGDCNQDGISSTIDALIAARHYVGLSTLVGRQFAACNVFGLQGGNAVPGSEVNILDALEIACFDVGLRTSLSCTP